MSQTLTPKTCRECKAPIMVTEYSPHEKDSEATGMAAYRWGDDADQYFVGWICNDCAWKHATTPGDGGSIGGGGSSMDFVYE